MLVQSSEEAVKVVSSISNIMLNTLHLRWLNTVLRAVSGSSRDAECFKLDKQTWRQKKQWYPEDYFSKSTHQNFVISGRIFTFIIF